MNVNDRRRGKYIKEQQYLGTKNKILRIFKSQLCKPYDYLIGAFLEFLVSNLLDQQNFYFNYRKKNEG